jgi:hypothetical protein
LCAGIKSGEIVLFDKGYVDFGHLRDLDERGAFWVTRAKDNMAYDVVRKMPKSKDEKILRDEVIVLSNPNKLAPELMRPRENPPFRSALLTATGRSGVGGWWGKMPRCL